MAQRDYAKSDTAYRGAKVAFRDVGGSTNARTLIAGTVPDRPCGHTLGVISLDAMLLSSLNSSIIDWSLRQRMAGNHLTLFIAEELAVLGRASSSYTASHIAALSFPSTVFAGDWLKYDESRAWKRGWAVTNYERKRRRAVCEATAAALFEFELDDFRWILRDNDHPVSWLASKPNSRSLDTKGFWRAEKEQDPELRDTVLAQIAFHDLKEKGFEAFLTQNDGEGWMLPETLRLADYDLGHDQRAHERQPVASALGPRFYDWQLEQSVDESWEECRRHAEVLSIINPIEKDEPKEEAPEEPEPEVPVGAQHSLFADDGRGNPKRKR
jgi:hypothetical protein